MSYTIDTSDLPASRKFLRGMRRAAENAQYRAVNRVASKTRTKASKRIREDVRLKAGYINQHLKVSRKARRDDPRATITARKRPTRLARFGAKQLTRRAPGAAGDPLRGIGAGRKAGGVAVNVSRNTGRARMPRAFLIPLSTTRGNVFGGQQTERTGHMGVFVRDGNRIRQLYGPSVDQLFRRLRGEIHGDVSADLQTQYQRQFSYYLRREAART
ncbi:phage tail protein [Thioalkalivibrio sp. ALgr3]|uniref:phage tail protein n=1 Tax=Thioalkalivibrio sp. ALgr3 TaxID=1239292 RepID=UPI000378A92D|nr:phage tail protein [Thioalkalivibrio sp. ALgr3]